MSLKARLKADMIAAMKSKDKPRLGTIRLINAAIKQREVDERIELTDTDVLAILDKMLKQRRESIRQYTEHGRDELAAQESFEMGIIQEYMPKALTETEIQQMIDDAMEKTGATTIRDMGKIMGILKPQMQGKADMGMVSGLIKQKLG